MGLFVLGIGLSGGRLLPLGLLVALEEALETFRYLYAGTVLLVHACIVCLCFSLVCGAGRRGLGVRRGGGKRPRPVSRTEGCNATVDGACKTE